MVLPDKNKKEVGISGEMSLGTAYEMNKDLIKRYEKELSLEKLKSKKEMYLKYLNDNTGNYYMLLCNDRKDYTVFHLKYNDEVIKSEDFSFNELLECLINRGKVYGFDRTEDNAAIEIWLMIDNEIYCYYFFNYDNAVIEC